MFINLLAKHHKEKANFEFILTDCVVHGRQLTEAWENVLT